RKTPRPRPRAGGPCRLSVSPPPAVLSLFPDPHVKEARTALHQKEVDLSLPPFQRLVHLLDGLDRFLIHLRQKIARADAGPRRGASLGHLGHNPHLLPAQPELLGGLGRPLLERNPHALLRRRLL